MRAPRFRSACLLRRSRHRVRELRPQQGRCVEVESSSTAAPSVTNSSSGRASPPAPGWLHPGRWLGAHHGDRGDLGRGAPDVRGGWRDHRLARLGGRPDSDRSLRQDSLTCGVDCAGKAGGPGVQGVMDRSRVRRRVRPPGRDQISAGAGVGICVRGRAVGDSSGGLRIVRSYSGRLLRWRPCPRLQSLSGGPGSAPRRAAGRPPPRPRACLDPWRPSDRRRDGYVPPDPSKAVHRTSGRGRLRATPG